ncbi:MAG: SgcJ/EcaC family oxidoreductase [Planctomycetia bacterium]|nr:SgcJ/EcaC family oxidoreductase [Planctomycetia bacterium]
MAPALFLFGVHATAGAAENADAVKSAEAAIRASGDAFTKAFNRGDAKTVAELWTPDGTVADDQGEMTRGRKAIEAEYAALFKEHPHAKIQIAIQSIEFPAPGTAVEDGVTTITTSRPGPPRASRYTAVHVRVDGQWLMASVRESTVDVPSSYARLQDLEFLVGKWQATSGGIAVKTEFQWIANKSFLKREYQTARDGVAASSGFQIIGWDAQAGKIRSWSFDSSGGHGTALWTPAADGWQLVSRGQTTDGTPTASRDRLIRVPGEPNVLGWQSSDRHLGNVDLPDSAEVVLDRVTSKK